MHWVCHQALLREPVWPHPPQVIADTHGLFDPAIAQHFQHADHIVHAGDIGKPMVIERLKDIAPVTAVSGNVDGYEERCPV